MATLTVVYDSRCGLCCHLHEWVGRQASFVAWEFLSSSSEGGRRVLEQLQSGKRGDELIVVNDEGDVWGGDEAWLVCLWGLVEFRPWALRLANPFLLANARRVYAAIARNREPLSRLLRFGSDEELERRLAMLPPDLCEPARRGVDDGITSDTVHGKGRGDSGTDSGVCAGALPR